jgi:hypothetical protein
LRVSEVTETHFGRYLRQHFFASIDWTHWDLYGTLSLDCLSMFCTLIGLVRVFMKPDLSGFSKSSNRTESEVTINWWMYRVCQIHDYFINIYNFTSYQT